MGSIGTLIEVENLTKVFYTNQVATHALSGIHLSIERGEDVAISGPSGCGKSTLLSILGLLDAPIRGRYLRTAYQPRALLWQSALVFATRKSALSFRASFDRGPHCRGKRRTAPYLSRRNALHRAKRAGEGSPSAREHDRPDEALPGAALRRPTAARGGCACARRLTLDPAG